MSYVNNLKNKILNAKIERIYLAQLTNSNKRKHLPPKYTKEELIEWVKKQPNFNTIFNNWINSNFSSEKSISIDRLDSTKGYSFDNIQLVTWLENRLNWKSELKRLRKNKSKHLKKHFDTYHKVFQFDLNGNYVNEYESITKASFETNLNRSNILRSISTNLLAGGYIWLDDTVVNLKEAVDKKLSNILNGDKRSKAIYQIDINGNVIKQYHKLSDVVKDGHNKANVSLVANGHRKLANNYIWLYAKDYETGIVTDRVNRLNNNRVAKLDKDLNIIETFINSRIASRETKIPLSNINLVINKKRKHAGGYIWRRMSDLA
jgi:hypothetical protein